MTKRLSNGQRSILAEKIMDWGNLVFTGLVIAQFVPGISSYQWTFIWLGLSGIIMAYITGIFLMKMEGGGTV